MKLFKKKVFQNDWRENQILEDFTKYTLSTSASDNQIYPDFCANASLNYNIFKEFRRSKIYQQIVEYVTYAGGQEYINAILAKDTSLLNTTNLDRFKQNDLWGNPVLFDYKETGTISSTTLRYINVLADIKELFGDLTGKSICEIGVGYGGQCRILSSYFSSLRYTLVDLRPVLHLVQRYLANYPLDATIKYKAMNELEPQHYDFVISNYAFAELRKEVQDIYIKKVLKHANSGFMIYNEGSTPEHFATYTKHELLQMIPNNPRILAETPITAPNNYVIAWGC